MNALLCLDGWAGRTETPVEVIGETRQKYRIRFLTPMRLPGARRFAAGDETTVPKYAIKIAKQEKQEGMSITSQQRFVASKCDRCGKATKAKQNGIGDLYTLPHEWDSAVSDMGSFCQSCISAYDEANWIAWLVQRYPPGEEDSQLLAP